jgi:hypothetical protein
MASYPRKRLREHRIKMCEQFIEGKVKQTGCTVCHSVPGARDILMCGEISELACVEGMEA